MSKPKKQPIRQRPPSPFSRNLEAILQERGLTQKAASEIAGVSAKVLNDWLGGTQPQDLIAVQKLARGLKCNFEWLLTGTKSSDSSEVSMSEVFDKEEEPAFSGFFEISAKRLKWKGNGSDNE